MRITTHRPPGSGRPPLWRGQSLVWVLCYGILYGALLGGCTPGQPEIPPTSQGEQSLPVFRLSVDVSSAALGRGAIEIIVPSTVQVFEAPRYGNTENFLDYTAGVGARDERGRRLNTTRHGRQIRVRNSRHGSYSMAYTYNVPQRWPGEVDHNLPTLDDRHGIFDGNATFLVPTGLAALPARLQIRAPPNWLVITSWGVGKSFSVPSTAELVAGLIAMGDFRLDERQVGQTPVRFAIRGPLDDPQLIARTAKIIDAQQQIVGPLPAPRLLIAIQTGSPRPVGTSLGGAVRLALPDRADPQDFFVQGTIAHELFHQYNGIGLRPRDDDDAKLFTEGFTNYFAVASLFRAQLISEQLFTTFVGRYRQKLEANRRYPGADYQTIQTGYVTDEVLRNLAYTKGPLVALLLDLALRQDTNGDRTLVDWFRQLFSRYRTIGYEVDDLLAHTISVSGQQQGAAVRVFETAFVGGAALDLDGLFSQLGISCDEQFKCLVSSEDERTTALRRAVFAARPSPVDR